MGNSIMLYSFSSKINSKNRWIIYELTKNIENQIPENKQNPPVSSDLFCFVEMSIYLTTPNILTIVTFSWKLTFYWHTYSHPQDQVRDALQYAIKAWHFSSATSFDKGLSTQDWWVSLQVATVCLCGKAYIPPENAALEVYLVSLSVEDIMSL